MALTTAGTLAQTLWARILGQGGEARKRMIKAILVGVIPGSLYWILGALCYRLDVTGKPAWMARRKIQPKVKLNQSEILRVIGRVAWGQFLVMGAFTTLTSPLFMSRIHVRERLPSLLTLAKFVGVSYVCQSAAFYYLHRLFHHPTLYRLFHKVHHEWKAPTALVGAYAHPVEQVVVNAVPGLLGAVLLQPHAVSMCAWLSLAMVLTCSGHSGYSIPWLHDAKWHDYHHKAFDCNYGTHWMDRLHGTLKHPPPREDE